jgi:hypothetical protein
VLVPQAQSLESIKPTVATVQQALLASVAEQQGLVQPLQVVELQVAGRPLAQTPLV